MNLTFKDLVKNSLFIISIQIIFLGELCHFSDLGIVYAVGLLKFVLENVLPHKFS